MLIYVLDKTDWWFLEEPQGKSDNIFNNHSGNFDFFQKGTLEKYYKHGYSAYLIRTEFIYPAKSYFFHQALNISSC